VLACFFAIGLSMVACHLLIPETPVDMRQLCGDARASAKWKTYAELSPNERQFLYSDCSGY
jgi:hypothetical protein